MRHDGGDAPRQPWPAGPGRDFLLHGHFGQGRQPLPPLGGVLVAQHRLVQRVQRVFDFDLHDGQPLAPLPLELLFGRPGLQRGLDLAGVKPDRRATGTDVEVQPVSAALGRNPHRLVVAVRAADQAVGRQRLALGPDASQEGGAGTHLAQHPHGRILPAAFRTAVDEAVLRPAPDQRSVTPRTQCQGSPPPETVVSVPRRRGRTTGFYAVP